MKAAVLALTTGLLASACGGSAAPGGSEEQTTTVQGYGLSITAPDGWEGRVYRLSPDYAITLEVASVELPPQGELMTGDRLGADDAYIVIDDIGAPPLREGEGRLPLAVDLEAIRGPYEGGVPRGRRIPHGHQRSGPHGPGALRLTARQSRDRRRQRRPGELLGDAPALISREAGPRPSQGREGAGIGPRPARR